jgi:hypothetical protein
MHWSERRSLPLTTGGPLPGPHDPIEQANLTPLLLKELAQKAAETGETRDLGDGRQSRAGARHGRVPSAHRSAAASCPWAVLKPASPAS